MSAISAVAEILVLSSNITLKVLSSTLYLAKISTYLKHRQFFSGNDSIENLGETRHYTPRKLTVKQYSEQLNLENFENALKAYEFNDIV